MKNMNDLAKKISVNEGKKKEVQIGDIKEILRLLALIMNQDDDYYNAFMLYGKRVAKQEEKKNAKR
jgi:hypothetical protein